MKAKFLFIVCPFLLNLFGCANSNASIDSIQDEQPLETESNKNLDSEQTWSDKIVFVNREGASTTNNSSDSYLYGNKVEIIINCDYISHPNYESWIIDNNLKHDDEYLSDSEKYQSNYFGILNNLISNWINKEMNFKWITPDDIYRLGPLCVFYYQDYDICLNDKMEFNELASYEFVKTIQIDNQIGCVIGGSE